MSLGEAMVVTKVANGAANVSTRRAILIIDKIKSFGNANANAEMNILQNSLDDFILENSRSLISKNQISAYFNPFALRVVNSL